MGHDKQWLCRFSYDWIDRKNSIYLQIINKWKYDPTGMTRISLKSAYKPGVIEAGCDEAGRGCLAGPVYAAAVILPQKMDFPELNDSKQLSPQKRYRVRANIERYALGWSVSRIDHEQIDQLNILNAAIKAMHRALDQLAIRPQHILIDGNRFDPYQEIPHKCVIYGDSHYLSIAAASVLAKTYRDDYMQQLHREYPCYGWDRNKGYATKEHRMAIHEYGLSPYHRRSFNLRSLQLKLSFPPNNR